jgi:hypothetical protein
MNPETDQFDEIGILDDEAFEDENPCLPGWELPISQYFEKSGAKAEYEYDFGDCWEHEIILEEIVNRVPRQKYPICLAGERACFDPEAFDPKNVHFDNPQKRWQKAFRDL